MKTIAAGLAVALALGVAPAAAQQQQTPPAATAGQEQTEVTLTELLNRLVQRGYSRYRDIRRVGDTYVIDVTTRDFREITLEADAVTGEIRELP
ncbi:MAG: hypothetical protein ACTS3R_15390 [Inquilinaceae bacterium]